MEATTDPPIPNINPIPVAIIKNGAAILTAASASLPIPFPTNIPSVMTNIAEKTIPSTVGTNNLRNNMETSILPKSILSFITFYLLFVKSGAKVGV